VAVIMAAHDVGGSAYADCMSERANAVIASVATLGVALGAAIWMTRISAWGPAVFTVVLAVIVVWLLISAEVHRSRYPRPEGGDETPHHGFEWSPS
jgi:fatty acid desaturase